jgi:microsomal dipeptidase-like Zn-dependent dipeptidase
MVASSFSAVGDSIYLSPIQSRPSGTEYTQTKIQLEWWLKGIVKSGEVKLVLKASDVPDVIGPDIPPGAILSIEGGDPLEGNPDRVDEFYRLGVRMITLMHYRNNELGDIMKQWKNRDPEPMHNGLTPDGRKVVERMQKVGMVVDVAHAHSHTLEQIAEMSSKPLVDSHTNPCPVEDSSKCGRFRTWRDMEWVVKTGGVVCTWPLAYKKDDAIRKTFSDWAREILEMKKRLGMNHVGLGTDGGGHLPALIEGYRDVRDLAKLKIAMQDVGFSQEEIGAYMGGNFYRVLKSCIG